VKYDGDDNNNAAVRMDDDDMLSDNEQEIKDEVNADVDGNVKHAKDVRGYDEGSQHHESNQDMQENEEDVTPQPPQIEEAEDEAGVGEYTKTMREVHSKYMLHLRGIEFQKSKNTAAVEIAFPLDFRKVLMLTLAEQALTKVLVRSVPNIEKCTFIKPKREADEPCLVVQGINFEAFYQH